MLHWKKEELYFIYYVSQTFGTLILQDRVIFPWVIEVVLQPFICFQFCSLLS